MHFGLYEPARGSEVRSRRLGRAYPPEATSTASQGAQSRDEGSVNRSTRSHEAAEASSRPGATYP